MSRERTSALGLHLSGREARMAGWALAFAALTGIGALLRVPLFPVPVTMQVFFVLLAGLLLGPYWGAASQLAYLAMGACGAPFFAAPPHAGPAVLFGPTGGYLWGFVGGAYLVGMLGRRLAGRSVVRTVAVAFSSSLAGIAVVYLTGTAWLAVWLGSASAAVGKGALPFIIPDLFKAAGATAVATMESLGRRRKRRHLS